MLFDVVAQSLKPVKLFSQQLATFLLFRVHLGVAQQCWAHARSLRLFGQMTFGKKIIPTRGNPSSKHDPVKGFREKKKVLNR